MHTPPGLPWLMTALLAIVVGVGQAASPHGPPPSATIALHSTPFVLHSTPTVEPAESLWLRRCKAIEAARYASILGPAEPPAVSLCR